MSTTPKFPTHAEQLLNWLAVSSTSPQSVRELDHDDCLALVSHVRTQANTLASTQAELELCRATVTEQADKVKGLEAQLASAQNESADLFLALTASASAHLATRRALATLIRGVCEALGKIDPDSDSLVAHLLTKALPDDYAARAEVAKADRPRADAQKGGAM